MFPPTTKARLKALAAKRGLSESALLKDLLELTIGGSVMPEPDGAEPVARAGRARACMSDSGPTISSS